MKLFSRIILLLTAILFISFFISVDLNTYGVTINELENRHDELQEQKSNIQEELSDAEVELRNVLKEREELHNEIDQMNETMEENKKVLKETEEDIEKVEKDNKQLQDEIDVIQKRIDKRFEILSDRLVSYQRSGGKVALIEIILGSKDFGELISRSTTVSKIIDADQQLITNHANDQQEVKTKQNKLKKQLSHLNNQLVELEGMQALIKDQKNAVNKKLEQLNDKEKELIALQDELKMKDHQIAALENEVKQQINEERNQDNNPEIVLASSRGESTDQDTSETSANNESNKTDKSNNKKQNTASNQSGVINTIIKAGYPHIGLPYKWAGKSPSTGFDCSGFISWAFAQGGVSVPSSTAALQYTGQKVSYSNVKPGDVVFFNTYKINGHAGIYIGNGKFIGSQNSTGLAIGDMTSGYWKNHFAGHVRRIVK